MPSWRLCLTLLLLPMLVAVGRAEPTTAPSSFDPAVTLPYLASDNLEGRGIGLAGLDTAAKFLADHFRAAGLKPLPGVEGFFQQFDYTADSRPGADCSLTIAGQKLTLDRDYRPLGFSSEGAFAGGVVFAGYGITSPARHEDDYAGIDAGGKVVLAMRFEPTDAKGKSLFAPRGTDWSDLASLSNKILTANRHGATALLLFTPAGLDDADPLLRFTSVSSSDIAAAALPVLHIRRVAAELLLDQGKIRPGVSVSGVVRIERTVVHLKNIVGCVPGAGPQANEYVVVGAHYDHLGRGRFGGIFGPAGAIYHGADDNASGTVTILMLARRAAQSPPRKRTVVFCLFTAEEEGLIGSEVFVAHPPIPLKSVAAMLNMDMVGRVRNEAIYVGGDRTAADFPEIVQAAARHQPLIVHPLPAMVGGHGGLGPSDHMSFALQRIPVLFLFSGLHLDYHRPSDTADKINYAGIAQVADLADRLIDGLAAMPRESYDPVADHPGRGPAANSGADHLPGAVLGINPDYTTESDDPGVLIQSVVSPSAAQAAGLHDGDRIMQFANKPLAGLQDLADCLAMARPGDKVTLKVRRGNQTLTLQATLGPKN